jgi:hypothetical protein
VQLEITPESVRRAIVTAPKMKDMCRQAQVRGKDRIRGTFFFLFCGIFLNIKSTVFFFIPLCCISPTSVWPPEGERGEIFYALQNLKNALPRVIVSGIATVERAVINFNEKDRKYNLLVEGTNLGAVMVRPLTSHAFSYSSLSLSLSFIKIYKFLLSSVCQ